MRLPIFYTYLLLFMLPVFGFAQNSYDFYISNTGNDNNSGKTISQPRKTLAGSADLFNADAKKNGHVSIGLGSGSTFTETFSPKYAVQVGTYSSNESNFGFAVLNGSDAYNSGWIKKGNSKNTYKQDITISGFTGNGINTIGQYSYVYVIEIDKELEKTAPITARKLLDFVSSEDDVDNTPGSFYESPSGPNAPVSVFIHTSNGLSPNANSKYRYEVAVRGKGIDLTTYTGKFENLWIRGFGAGYGGVPAGNNSYFNKVIFGPGAAIHHAVIKSGIVNNSLFLPTSGNVNGGALIFYDTVGGKRHNNISNSIFLDIPYSIYSHASYGVNYSALELNNVLAFEKQGSPGYLVGAENNDSVLLNNLYTDGYNTVYSGGSPKYVRIQNSCFRNTNLPIKLSSDGVNAFFNNDLCIINGSGGTAIRLIENSNISLTNSVIQINAKNSNLTNTRLGTVISALGGQYNHVDVLGNIFICNVDPGNYISMGTSNADNGTLPDRWNKNVYIVLSGEMHWYVGSSVNLTKFSDWQAKSGQDKNSLYFDLRNDPRGLKAIFIDPDNGDYELANTPEANKIRALNAGMTKPNTCFLAKPSYEAAAQMIQSGNVFTSSSCTNPCMLNVIRGGSFLYADIVDNSNVAVEWSNSAQLNIDHYEIERALFGSTDYVKIASVPVAANDTYTYIDNTVPDAGIYTYRLTVVATNGNRCSSYNYTITVTSVPQTSIVKIYPNPSHGKINVSLRNIKDITSISVVNNIGIKVKLLTTVSGSDAQFDLTNQPPGPYWIKIESAHGSYVEPFILL